VFVPSVGVATPNFFFIIVMMNAGLCVTTSVSLEQCTCNVLVDQALVISVNSCVVVRSSVV
jgi:hypothetical protein